MNARPVLALAVATLLTVTACSNGGGGGDAEFPEKTITWVVPYAAGGNTDSISRVVAESMGEALGQEVVVENREGGSGAIGTQHLANTTPDGYTIGLFTTGTLVVTPLVNNLGYTHEDFDNIGLIARQPVLFLVMPDSEYGDIDALVEAARANAGSLTVGVPGASTPQAYELQRMAAEHDVEFGLVPFDSNAEVVNALRGGNVDAVALNASQEVQSQVESGELKALAVGEPERVEWIDDVPTLVESGFDGLDVSGTLIGLTAPKGLPDDVRDTLADALDEALSTDRVVQLVGSANIPSEFVGPQEITDLLTERKDLYEDLLGSE